MSPQIILDHNGLCPRIQEITRRIKVDPGNPDPSTVGAHPPGGRVRRVVGIPDAFFPADDGQFKTGLDVECTRIHDVDCFSFLRVEPFASSLSRCAETLTSEKTSKSRELPGGLNLTTRAGSRRLPSLDAERQ